MFCRGSGGEQGHSTKSHNERKARTARRFRSAGRRQKCANQGPHHQSADVSGVADAGDRGSDNQVIEDEAAEAAEHLLVDLQVRRCLFQIDESDQHSRHAKNSAGSAGSRPKRVAVHAGDAAKDAAREIREKKREPPEKNFRGAAQIPEAPHVEPNVNNPEMHKHAGDQPPPLPVQREWAEVRAERNGLLRRGQERRDAAEHHDGGWSPACLCISGLFTLGSTCGASGIWAAPRKFFSGGSLFFSRISRAASLAASPACTATRLGREPALPALFLAWRECWSLSSI